MMRLSSSSSLSSMIARSSSTAAAAAAAMQLRRHRYSSQYLRMSTTIAFTNTRFDDATITATAPTAATSFLFSRHQRRAAATALQQHQQYHHPRMFAIQSRSYVFLPMSLPELIERAERWIEKTESRIIKVKLLNRQRFNQHVENRNEGHRLRKQQYQLWKLHRSDQYHGFKLRRKDQYKLWKLRQSDHIQGFKLRHQDRYINWKLRRQIQYQRFKLRRKDGWIKAKQRTSTSATTMMMMNNYNNQCQYQQIQHQHQRIQQLELELELESELLKPIIVEVKEYSKPEWFDIKSGRPLTAKDSTGYKFVNPWQSQSTNGIHSLSTIIKWRYQRFIREYININLSHSWSWLSWLSSWPTTTLVIKEENINNDIPDSLLSSPLLTHTVPKAIPIPVLSSSSSLKEANNDNDIVDIEDDNNNVVQEIILPPVHCTWIGHSTCLFQIPIVQEVGQQQQSKFTILTDPIFSNRASPFQNFLGVPRELPPAYTVKEIIHATKNENENNDDDNDNYLICCITHDHYDHMDKDSVIELQEYVKLWVVPLGIADWLVDRCCIDRDKIVELKWWQKVRIENIEEEEEGKGLRRVIVIDNNDIEDDDDDGINKNDDGNDYDNKNEALIITCCPASHWSGRNFLDRNARLWCSFAFSTTAVAVAVGRQHQVPSSSSSSSSPLSPSSSSYNIFFCGDTGYPKNFPLFRQIGDHLGPFDLACIPIGAYEPQEMNRDAHCNPMEAVQIHIDLQSKRSIPIHWGSFQLAEESMDEPPRELEDAITRAANSGGNNNSDDDVYSSINFKVLGHGNTLVLKK
jgi:N-acyl-phosphatidylethanolamine-hydrolysing phospholipase D